MNFPEEKKTKIHLMDDISNIWKFFSLKNHFVICHTQSSLSDGLWQGKMKSKTEEEKRWEIMFLSEQMMIDDD